MILEILYGLVPAALSLFVLFYFLHAVFIGGSPNIVRYQMENYFETPDGHFVFPSINDKSSVNLSVIIPSYNEEKRLPVMLDEALQYLEEKEGFNYKYEIIIVDDGSKDKTFEVATKYSLAYGSEKIRVMRLEKNRGKGGAVRLGMISARGNLLLMVDADGATRFSDIDKVEEKLNEINTEPHGMAVSVGSRAHLEVVSIATRSLFRTVLMKGFHALVWFLCVRSIRDSQCGFKLFTRPAARALFFNLHVERWAFDVELLYIAEQLKIPVSEVAVKWMEIDGSKIVPVFSWIQMGMDIVLIWLHYLLRIWTIKRNIE